MTKRPASNQLSPKCSLAETIQIYAIFFLLFLIACLAFVFHASEQYNIEEECNLTKKTQAERLACIKAR